jgi:uncharacterized protein
MSSGLASGLLALLLTTQYAIAEETIRPYQVVFQVSEADPASWTLALNNVRNTQKLIKGQSNTLEIVAYGPGIDLLRFDSIAAPQVQEAIKSGVLVKICENTMKAKHLTRDDLQPNLIYVPAGVVEIIDRQREGYSYIRP